MSYKIQERIDDQISKKHECDFCNGKKKKRTEWICTDCYEKQKAK